jgi:hypothetical protein
MYQEIMCVLIAFTKRCHPPDNDDLAKRYYRAMLELPPALI